MMGTALGFVRRELNGFFRELLGDSRELVVFSSLTGRDEASAGDVSNHILFALTQVRQETTLRNQPLPLGVRRVGASYPPLSIVLHVVFVAHFTDYVTGLDYLSDLIAYLQAHPVFDHDNSPDLDPRIDKLTFAMVNLDYSEVSSLWSTLGTDFRPSVFYEVRMLPLSDPRPSANSRPTPPSPP